MDDNLDIELILRRNQYGKIYQSSYLIIIILLIIIYIIFTYQYQSYYITYGKMSSNQLIIAISPSDIIYINNHHELLIDDKKYYYKIVKIDENLYLDENMNNYQYIYLKVDKLTNLDNYVYEVKFNKEKKVLAKYLKDYL